MDKAGHLFGTTAAGGFDDIGTVFEIGANGVETILYSFTGNNDGGRPVGELVMDSKGKLYGVCNSGTVYVITP